MSRPTPTTAAATTRTLTHAQAVIRMLSVTSVALSFALGCAAFAISDLREQVEAKPAHVRMMCRPMALAYGEAWVCVGGGERRIVQTVDGQTVESCLPVAEDPNKSAGSAGGVR